MALTPSTMLPLGTPLPVAAIRQALSGGQLQQVSGTPLDPQALAGEPMPVVVAFLCAHCPFVKHIEPELTRLAHDFAGQLQIVAISSNSLTTHPQDAPAGLAAQAEARGWTFPYLFDSDQGIARAFQAACTPDLFLFDRQHRLAYRGQLDASRPGNGLPLDGRDLRAALAAVLAGRPPSSDQRPSIGCNIKWEPGQEPAWAR